MVAVLALTAVPTFTEHPHQPGIGDIFPDAIFGEGTLFEFNRLTLARIIMSLLLCAAMVLTVRRLRVRPGRGQVLVEIVAEFVRGGIAQAQLGPATGKRYAPFLSTIFLTVLFMNIAGIIPGINIAASSAVAVPLVLAVIAYVGFIAAGIKTQGLGRFLHSQLFPPGLPKVMYLIITPIEILSTFVVRPVTLTLRLLANMISGHLLLAMTYFGTTSLLIHLSTASPAAALTGIAMMVMTLFEVFVAILQAYIFTILAAVYIKLSVEAH